MSWHLIERILDEVSKQSTLIGKVWITLLFVFRIVAVTRIGDTVYADEQAAFKCNTKQPGCENVCFNDFSPISHVRFWGFQIIIVATPAMIFMVYAAHAVSTIPGAFKLAGRKLESPSVRLANASKGTSKFHKHSERCTSLNEVIVSSSRQNRRNCDVTNSDWSRNKYDAVKRWKTCSGFGPDAGISNLKSQSGCWRKDQDRPPAYDDDSGTFFEEVPLDNILSNHLRTVNDVSCARAESQSNPGSRQRENERIYPKFTEIVRQVPLHHVRRYSDGDLVKKTKPCTPGPPRRLSFFTSPTSSIDTSPANVTSHPHNTSPHYSMAKLCHVSDIPDPNFVWQTSNDRQLLPASLIHLTPRCDRDSAFSERMSSLAGSFSPKSMNSTKGKTSTGRKASLLPLEPRSSQTSVKNKPGICTNSSGSQKRGISDGKKSSSGTIVKRPNCNLTSSQKNKSQHTLASAVVQNRRAGKFIKRVEFCIGFAYFMQCLLRLLLEIAFLLLQYLFFEFEVPELYKCSRWPCPNTVDCFISRPNEKTLMLYFMFGVTVLCIALTWYEILYLIWRRISIVREKQKKKQALLGTDQANRFQCKIGSRKVRKGKYDLSKHPYLLEGYSKFIHGYSVDMSIDSASSSDSKSTKSSRSDTETDDLQQNSFNSEDLSSMFDNEMAEVGDYNEQNEAAEIMI